MTLGKIIDMANKNPAAQALGQLGGKARARALSKPELSEIGKKGAKARASKLTPAQRSEIAKKAVQARIAKLGQRTTKGKKACGDLRELAASISARQCLVAQVQPLWKVLSRISRNH